MTHQEIIRVMLKQRGYSQKKLAREMGTQACTVTAVMKSENLYTKTLLKMCKVLGYEVIIRPKNYVRPMELEMVFNEES